MNSQNKTLVTLTIVMLLTITFTVVIMDENDGAAPYIDYYEKDADGNYSIVSRANSAPYTLKGAYITDHVFLGWQWGDSIIYPGDQPHDDYMCYALYGELPSTIPCYNPTDENGTFEFTCNAGDLVMLEVGNFAAYTFDDNLHNSHHYYNKIDGGTYYVLYPENPGTYTITAKATQPEDYFNKTFTITVLDPIRTVSFSSEGSIIHTETVEPGSTIQPYTPPAREGYTFGGWYTDTTFQIPFDFNTSIISNIILYAKWIEKPVTITFMVEGQVYSTLAVPKGSVGVVYTPIMVTGVFAGWYYDSAFTQKYDATRALDSDITLYACGVPPLIFTSEPNASANIQQVSSYGMFFFDATDSSGRYQIEWDFGDGNTSTDAIAYNTYSAPGLYTVTLKVTNIYGESSTTTYDVVYRDLAAGGGDNDLRYIVIAVICIIGGGLVIRRII